LERECDAVRSEIVAAESEHQSLEVSVDQLRHSRTAGSGIRQNLEGELRLLLAEAGVIKREREEQARCRVEMQQQTALMAPALLEAKRCVRILEERLEDARAAADQDRKVNEQLERETGTGQDKMQALRDLNVRVSEQCTEKEAQLAAQASSAKARSASHGALVRSSSANRVGTGIIPTGCSIGGGMRRAASGGRLPSNALASVGTSSSSRTPRQLSTDRHPLRVSKSDASGRASDASAAAERLEGPQPPQSGSRIIPSTEQPQQHHGAAYRSPSVGGSSCDGGVGWSLGLVEGHHPTARNPAAMLSAAGGGLTNQAAAEAFLAGACGGAPRTPRGQSTANALSSEHLMYLQNWVLDEQRRLGASDVLG